MEIAKPKTLVNFKASEASLRAFDDACYLSGSTRTQILNKLMVAFTSETASTMPKQISEQRRKARTLRTAVKRSFERKRALAHQNTRSPVRTVPLKDKPRFQMTVGSMGGMRPIKSSQDPNARLRLGAREN